MTGIVNNQHRGVSSVDVCIDIGGTGVRARLLRASDHAVVNSMISSESLGELVTQLCALDIRCERVAVGATGVWGDASRFDTAALHPLGAHEVRIADDGLTAHLGALTGRPGIVVAIGTGLVTVRMTADGSFTRIGGYGLLLDDRGSGAWIGQRAVRDAIDTHEGVSDHQSILELCIRELGPITLWSERILSTGPRALAALCSPLALHAREGDADAAAIFTAAGAHIADRLHAAVRSAATDGETITTTFTGGAAAALDLLMPGIRSRALDLPLEFVPAEGSPLDGAERLLRIENPSAESKLLRVITHR
ncbi:BadF/BadG/BcrA/BcrD ATPase family protein [Microbacterium sp. A93]|uniref:BadF/BadG/BcrA/BcrD ATPase family protein n=1 Tax=Microbacterium sp. A93 TaxID=3450716 RepID=UPI003F444203